MHQKTQWGWLCEAAQKGLEIKYKVWRHETLKTKSLALPTWWWASFCSDSRRRRWWLVRPRRNSQTPPSGQDRNSSKASLNIQQVTEPDWGRLSHLLDAEAGHRHDHGGVVADVVRSHPAGEDGFLFGRQRQLPTFVPWGAKEETAGETLEEIINYIVS